MMKRYALLVALLVMLRATEAMAATIGFDDLYRSNLSSFTDPYVEDGYTVSATGGQWFEAHVFGNGVPAIGSGPIYTADGGTSQITINEGGERFIFQGVDLTSNSALGTTYTIAGSLETLTGTVLVFTETVEIDEINRFESKLFSNLGPVDKLTITGTRGTGVTSFNIDNIRVGSYIGSGSGTGSGSCPSPNPDCNVPEPGSMLLLGAGLVGIEIWRRKRGLG
jgi:hypothetical protein